MRVILLRYGEIFLKGNNRNLFESALAKNIKNSIAEYQCEFKKIAGRYEVSNYDVEIEHLLINKLTKVFGIHSLSIADRVETDVDAIVAVIKGLDLANHTFRVTTRRASKIFPIHSMDFNRQIGQVVLENFEGTQVDLHQPEIEIKIDIRENGYTYISTGDIRGANGMPLGTAGKGLLLLSGGIDSPVAGYYMARRGLTIEAIHFHSYPYTSELARQKVIDLAKKLDNYVGKIRMHIVSVTHVQEAINQHCDRDYMITLLRRMMIRIACKVAKDIEAGALVTGESLGQVASQTLQSINMTNMVADIPVFRPLIAYDKEDIIKISREIDTYETSILPYEDCCTVFLPKNPVIKPKLQKVLAEESKLDIETLLQKSLDSIETIVI